MTRTEPDDPVLATIGIDKRSIVFNADLPPRLSNLSEAEIEQLEYCLLNALNDALSNFTSPGRPGKNYCAIDMHLRPTLHRRRGAGTARAHIEEIVENLSPRTKTWLYHALDDMERSVQSARRRGPFGIKI